MFVLNANTMKAIRIVLMLLVTIPVYGQLDIKTDLISTIANRPNVETELIISKNYSIGFAGFVDIGNKFLDKGIGKSGYRLMFIGRHYFQPFKKGDKWYAGLYTGLRKKEYSEIFSGVDFGYYFKQYIIGGNIGHKWILKSNIILETDLFVGRTFSKGSVYNDPIAAETGRIFDMNSDIDAWLRVSLGYRLTKK